MKEQITQPDQARYLPQPLGGVRIYDNTEFPHRSEDMPEYSEDVIAVDSEGMMCIAYYHFEDEQWFFHSDTLYEGYEKNFSWIYKPQGFIHPIN
jgi:hypothetical protein